MIYLIQTTMFLSHIVKKKVGSCLLYVFTHHNIETRHRDYHKTYNELLIRVQQLMNKTAVFVTARPYPETNNHLDKLINRM